MSSFCYSDGDDPRLKINRVRECVAAAKGFMKSEDYSGAEKEQDLIGACRDVDADCVQAVGESLHATDANEKRSFLTLVKACRGHGTGKCFIDLKSSVPSYDRREIAQILNLLKKCE